MTPYDAQYSIFRMVVGLAIAVGLPPLVIGGSHLVALMTVRLRIDSRTIPMEPD